MFDNYVHKHYSSPREVHVQEHRAPTDDSIRLAQEYMDKARAEVLDAIVVEGNTVHGVITRWDDPATRSHAIKIAFSLNGQDYLLDPIRIPRNYVLDRVEWVNKLRDEVAKAIANELILTNAKQAIP